MKNFSKFLKNKNTVTILGIIACLAILFIGYTSKINSKLKYESVFVAGQTIQPKTLIEESMIVKVRIPKDSLKGKYYKEYNDIVGKYSNYNTMIAKGSVFYGDLLIEENELPDSILINANKGERIVSFPVDTEITYGNSIMPGTKIDIYVSLYTNDAKVVFGEFLKNIEVIAVKDEKGRNVFENTNETRTPAFIYFTLPETKYLLFNSLSSILVNEVQLKIALNNQEPVMDDGMKDVSRVKSSYLYKFILDETHTIDKQSDLYKELLNEIEQQELEEERRKKDEALNGDNTTDEENNDNTSE